LTLAALSSKIKKRNESVSAQPGSGQRSPYKRSFMAGPKEDFILMMVGGLTLDPTTKMPIVVLKDPDNKLNLPIWIGPLEAASMATELQGIRPARPMTHDLLRNLLGDLGATVEAVEITELRENTYYARIEVKTRDGAAVGIDSRPSDAISIALRTKSPIYVAKTVLESSSELRESAEQAVSAADQNLAGVSRDKWSEILEKMSPEDFKYKM
jgi:bifunctional DNase/RNase